MNEHPNLFRPPSKTKVRFHSLHLADEKGNFEDVKKPAQIEQHPGDGEPSSVYSRALLCMSCPQRHMLYRPIR